MDVKRLNSKQINNTPALEMRRKRTSHMSIFEVFAEHDSARELSVMTEWLSEHAEVLEKSQTLKSPYMRKMRISKLDLNLDNVIRIDVNCLLNTYFVALSPTNGKYTLGAGYSYEGNQCRKKR